MIGTRSSGLSPNGAVVGKADVMGGGTDCVPVMLFIVLSLFCSLRKKVVARRGTQIQKNFHGTDHHGEMRQEDWANRQRDEESMKPGCPITSCPPTNRATFAMHWIGCRSVAVINATGAD